MAPNCHWFADADKKGRDLAVDERENMARTIGVGRDRVMAYEAGMQGRFVGVQRARIRIAPMTLSLMRGYEARA
jgi:hypothetical protein